MTDAHLVTDRETGKARGFGFVTMGTGAAAQAAITGRNGSTLDGRALRVNEGPRSARAAAAVAAGSAGVAT